MRWVQLLFPLMGFAAVGMSFHAGVKGAKQAPDPQPILKAHCIGCHGGASPAANLDLTQSSDKLAAMYIVAKGDATDSLIIRRVVSQNRPMPPTGARLSDEDVATLKDWITSQAPNPMPVFQAKCVKCHGGASPAGRLDLSKGLSDLASMPQVKPGDPAHSTLFKRVSSGPGQMPPGGPPLSDSDQALISGWINSLNDPTVVINGRCMPCHRGDKAAGGLNMAVPLTELAKNKDIFKGDPDESLLMKRVTGKVQPQMPPGDHKLSDAQVDVLAHWITSLGQQ